MHLFVPSYNHEGVKTNFPSIRILDHHSVHAFEEGPEGPQVNSGCGIMFQIRDPTLLPSHRL